MKESAMVKNPKQESQQAQTVQTKRYLQQLFNISFLYTTKQLNTIQPLTMRGTWNICKSYRN